jgi:hypothetical protein
METRSREAGHRESIDKQEGSAKERADPKKYEVQVDTAGLDADK